VQRLRSLKGKVYLTVHHHTKRASYVCETGNFPDFNAGSGHFSAQQKGRGAPSQTAPRLLLNNIFQ
jgi:hypothetical protein